MASHIHGSQTRLFFQFLPCKPQSTLSQNTFRALRLNSQSCHTKRIYKIKATETLHHTDRNPYDLKDKSHISKAAYDRCKNIRSALITHLTNKYGEHIVPGENQTPSFVDAETNNSITIERCSLGYISRNLRNTARSTYTVIYLNSALESALPSERTLEDEERKKATDSRRLNNIKQNF